jgi:hypothetical protein
MAPILFLFIMSAFYDLLEIEYEKQGIKRIDVLLQRARALIEMAKSTGTICTSSTVPPGSDFSME